MSIYGLKSLKSQIKHIKSEQNKKMLFYYQNNLLI